VGYEDGGLLTDAIRKNPNCVLLLDEIEKAHSDIYNILLQVMDYARLTDNRGNKAESL
jgi:ATP-dependent Clp protease ATP-binding subunit ClpA